MAFYSRLKMFSAFERCVKFTLVTKTNFHFLSRLPKMSSTSFQNNQRTFFLKIFGKPSKSALKQADDVPDSFEMIYRNTFSHYLWGAQVVSILSGALVLTALLAKSKFRNYQRETVEWTTSAVPIKHEELYYITTFVVILVLVQNIVSRTPIRIYKVPKTSKYIAINYGNYFFGKVRHTFLRGEIIQQESSGILPWRGSRYLIQTKTNHQPVILMEYFFRKPADLNIMLGQQNDPDLEEKKE